MICPNCRSRNPDQARFCSICGSPLQQARAVEGERKRITVLFADVVGSTAMAEKLDPEEVVELMNGAFAFMTAAIARYEGTIARLMGDAVLAFFGAPEAHEDDPERAVRAALEIRDAAQAYARDVQARYGVAFNVRVGIDTGLVVAGDVGSGLRGEYTAMGDTPNVAARLQSAAEPGDVLISADTHRFVKHLVDVQPRGALTVKGKSRPVESFSVIGLKATPGRARGLEGVHSPVVGRDTELAALDERLARLMEGSGGFIALLGEAGLGKSRLVAELRERYEGKRLRWLEGRSVSYGRGLAYHPWRQVIRQSIGAEEDDSPDDVRARLGREVCTCCRRPGGDVPFLETILAVESEDSLNELRNLEGEDLAGRIADAIEGYLCALAQMKPTIIVFDDLHWGDEASIELIARMRAVVDQYPLLFLCVLRPDRGAPSWRLLESVRADGGERYLEIALDPLDASEARDLLANLLHVEDLPDALRTAILAKSEGNPFFLEEVLRSLIDSGHIVRDGERWRATADIAQVTIPDTLVGVLSARIDRLPDTTKRVAQTAAVLGRIFARRVLSEVCAEGPPDERIDDVGPHLDTLVYEEIVRERPRRTEPEYIFKHALTQEAAYDLLLVRRRRELHRRAGLVMEKLYAQQLEEYAAVLAYHFRQAGEWQRAAEHSLTAANRSMRVYALREALEHFGAARDAFSRVPAARGRLVDATLEWLDTAIKLRMHETPETRAEMLDRIEEAEKIARDLGDRRRLAQALVAKGNLLTLSGFPVSAYNMLRQASGLADELNDESLILLPFFLTTMVMVDDDPRSAVPHLERVIALAREHRDRGIEAHALALLAVGRARLGEFAAAREIIEQALQVAPQTHSAIKEADVLILAGEVFYELGDLKRGLELTQRGAELALSVSGFECACAGYAETGFGRLHSDQLPEALRSFEKSVELGMKARMEITLNQVRAGEALARHRSGEDGAIAELERRLAAARDAYDRFGEAFIARELARIQLEAGDPDRAAATLDTALVYYRERGMLPYLAATLNVLAAIREAQGRAAEAAAARAEEAAIRERLDQDARRDSIQDARQEASLRPA